MTKKQENMALAETMEVPVPQTRPVADTLTAAMGRVFAQLRPVGKNAQNPHFRNRYADLAAIDSELRPLLAENGLWMTQPLHEGPDGSVIVETIVYHTESGDSMSLGRLPMPLPKRDPQGVGSAIKYGRRYAAESAFCIATTDDDGEGARRAIDSEETGETITEQQAKGLRLALVDLKGDEAAFCSLMECASLESMLASQYGRAQAAIEAKRKQIAKNGGAS